MHAGRVTSMLREVLRGQGLNVRRPDAEHLISVRAYSAEQAIEHVGIVDEMLNNVLPVWIEASTLPKEPDDEALDEVCQLFVESSFSLLPAW